MDNAGYRRLGDAFPLLAAPYVGVVLLSALVAGTIAVRVAGPRMRPRVVSPVPALSRRIAIGGLWLAPVPMLAELGAPFGFLIGGIAAISVATCMRDFYVPPTMARFGSAQLWVAVSAGAVLHLGVIAALLNKVPAALALTGLGCFAVTLLGGAEVSSKIRGASWFKLGANFAAVLLTVVMILSAGTRRFTGLRGGVAGTEGTKAAEVPAAGYRYSGVILRPPPKRFVVLPPQLTFPVQPVIRAMLRPVSIPFSAQYWFFYSGWRVEKGKRVYLRSEPPEDSLVEDGDPLSWTMSTAARQMPLVMRAHQPIAPALDVRCCRRIDVAIDITDVDPGSLSIELVLVDSTLREGRYKSLGVVPIPAARTGALVPFALTKLASGSFDAFEVWFHLAPDRRGRSANVAIERFDLLGR